MEQVELETPPLARHMGELLARMRAARPLVQNITNFVSMDIAANALLAAGASPAMVHAPEELDDFGALISALVINIGTLSVEWVAGMLAAAAGARERGKPWVLDPVGAGATAFRNRTVLQLLEHRPSVVRGNASEILAIAAAVGLDAARAAGKGVDSGNTADEAAAVAVALARRLGCTVVATGAIDVITDGQATRRVANGSPLMAQVTAVGCALSAITGAFCAVAGPFDAATAAVALVGVAGDVAAEAARWPGSFRVAFIDALASVAPADVQSRLRIS